jgi:hypothetical protein
MPRAKGDSRWYLITEMVNGWVRAECHRPECDWWEDHDCADRAKLALKDHRKEHRTSTKKPEAQPR